MGVWFGIGEVAREEEWRDPKRSKTRWDLLAHYHLSDKDVTEARADEAGEEVVEVLRYKAIFQKPLQKGGLGGALPSGV